MKNKFEADLGTYYVFPFIINFKFQTENYFYAQKHTFYLKSIIDYNFRFLKNNHIENIYSKKIYIIIEPKLSKDSILKFKKNKCFYQLFFKKNRRKYVVFTLLGLSDLYNLIKFIYDNDLPKNYLIIHSSCVLNKKNNTATVICGKSGTGKTTLSNILERRNSFIKLSDDLTLMYFNKRNFFVSPVIIDYHFLSLFIKYKFNLIDLYKIKVNNLIILKKSNYNIFQEVKDKVKAFHFFSELENINQYFLNKLIAKRDIRIFKINFFDHNFKNLILDKLISFL